MSRHDQAIAFAPASVGNVAVGFDVLGYSALIAGDRVRAVRTAARGVRIAGVTGLAMDLPLHSNGTPPPWRWRRWPPRSVSPSASS